MKRHDNSHVNAFVTQSRRDWPNLTREQCIALARQRDAGIEAANRLTSTVKLTDTQCLRLVQLMAGAREAVRLLTLQGLPWAFQRSARLLKHDLVQAIDRACDCAYNCAMKYDPERGCLSTIIAKDVYFKGIKKLKMQERSELLVFTPMEDRDRIDEDRGHAWRHDQETRRQKLMELIASVPDERERKILTLRAEGCKLREIGEAMGLSKERVRQIQDRAIRSLKVQAGTATGREKDLYCKHQRGLKRMAMQRAKAMA